MTEKILSVKDEIIKMYKNGASKSEASRYIKEMVDL
jgi:hypothetical protein